MRIRGQDKKVRIKKRGKIKEFGDKIKDKGE